MPQKLVTEASQDRYKSSFTSKCRHWSHKTADGSMKKGWEKLKLPVISTQQPQQGILTTPNQGNLTTVATPVTPISTTTTTALTPLQVNQRHLRLLNGLRKFVQRS
jgi:hypothetical protein